MAEKQARNLADGANWVTVLIFWWLHLEISLHAHISSFTQPSSPFAQKAWLALIACALHIHKTSHMVIDSYAIYYHHSDSTTIDSIVQH